MEHNSTAPRPGDTIYLPKHDTTAILLLSELIALYLGCQVMRIVMPRISRRMSSHPKRRQRQIYTLLPVLLLKTIVMVLLFTSLDFSWLRMLFMNEQMPPPNSTETPAPNIKSQFLILLVMSTSYIFEVLHRPCSLELISHHISLQALPYYYWFYAKDRMLAEVATLGFDNSDARAMSESTRDTYSHIPVMQFFVLMTVFGPGVTDGFSDLTFLLYYTTSPMVRRNRMMVELISSGATIARGIQWVLLSGFVFCHWSMLMEALGLVEKVVFAVSIPLWFWTEVDEILKLRGMTRKFVKMYLANGVKKHA